MPNNNGMIGQPAGLPEAVQVLPVLQSHLDVYHVGEGFVAPNSVQGKTLAPLRFGGGLVQASFYFANGMPCITPLVVTMLGSIDGVNFVEVHRKIKLYNRICYPLTTISENARTLDLPIRFFYWTWRVDIMPTDAPYDTIAIVSAINRPISGTLSDTQLEAY